MWVSAVGGALDGKDTTHRVAKANRPGPKAVARDPVLELTCDWSGPPGRRWCRQCRWVERSGECPGSIIPAALLHNARLRARGVRAHVLVQLLPQRDDQLVRQLPVVVCAACGMSGSVRAASFAEKCGHPSAKGKATLARLAKQLAPAVPELIAVEVRPLEG